MKVAERILWAAFLFAVVMALQEKGLTPVGPVAPKNVRVLLVRETADATPALQATIATLRGAKAAELGKRLEVLDDDGTDENGAQVISAEQIGGTPLPCVLLIDVDNNKVFYRQPIGAAPTPDQIIAIVKDHG